MSYTRLPRIELGTTVDDASARQDRISVTFGGWYYLGDFSELVPAVIGMSEEQHQINQSASLNIFTTFNPERLRRESCRLRFAQREQNGADGQRLFGRSLMSGDIEFNCVTPYVHGARNDTTNRTASQYRIEAPLQLNPSRMLNHQDVHRIVTERRSDELEYPEISLFTRRDAVTSTNEFSLDGNDNVIIHPRHHLMSMQPHWHEYRNRYLLAVDDFLAGIFRRYLPPDEGVGSGIQREPRFSLPYVETYWEFQHDNPIEFMDRIRPHVMALGRNSRRFGYRYYDFVEDHHQNSTGYRVDVAAGVELSLYAKTNRRIRLEIRHSMQNLTQTVARAPIPSSYTTDSIDGVFELLDQVAANAVRYANDTLRAIEQVFCDDEEQASAYELVLEITQAVEFRLRDVPAGQSKRNRVRAAQRQLLAHLVLNNRYVTLDNDPHQETLRYLQERGVLVMGGHRVRRLANKYLNARRILATRFPEHLRSDN